MKRYIALVFASLAAACGLWGMDETVEPVVKYTLVVDGKEYPIEVGKQSVLEGSFLDPKVTLTAAKTRLFAYGGIQFRYPAYFAWEADVRGTYYRNWTLSGNDFKIMYFVLQEELTPAEYVIGMQKQFGKSKVEDIERQLGGKTFKGKRVTIEIGGSSLVQDALAIPSSRWGEWRMLVLQDSLADEKQSTRETDLALKFLRDSFAVKP